MGLKTPYERTTIGSTVTDHEDRIRRLERARRPPAATAGLSTPPPEQHLNVFGAHPWTGFYDGTIDMVWIDNSYRGPGRAYVNNYRNNAFGSDMWVDRSSPDSSQQQFRMLAGPKNSVWALRVGYNHGPDYGIVGFKLQSLADTDGVMDNPTTSAPLWITMTNGDVDGYEDVSGRIYPIPHLAQNVMAVKFAGDPGDPFTTASYAGSPSVATIDGGPGLYGLTVFINGKNASSSGYKIGLWDLWWVRMNSATDLEPLY